MTNTATRSTVKAVYWQAMTPVHCGTGQTSASVIDLPIAREKATHDPVLPASSIKGVLRAGRQDEDNNRSFGSPKAAGDLTFTDARILCLPVRSYAGTFAYVTCPHILTRLDRDREALGLAKLFGMMSTAQESAAQVCPGSALVHDGKVLFEDIDLSAGESAKARSAAQAIAAAAQLDTDFATRFAIVSDDVFAYFSETATEISAHVRLNTDSKTVETGGLWYEEAVPAEALFASFVISGCGEFEVLNTYPYVQLGGRGSVGKGLLKIAVEGGA